MQMIEQLVYHFRLCKNFENQGALFSFLWRICEKKEDIEMNIN